MFWFFSFSPTHTATIRDRGTKNWRLVCHVLYIFLVVRRVTFCIFCFLRLRSICFGLRDEKSQLSTLYIKIVFRSFTWNTTSFSLKGSSLAAISNWNSSSLNREIYWKKTGNCLSFAHLAHKLRDALIIVCRWPMSDSQQVLATIALF